MSPESLKNVKTVLSVVGQTRRGGGPALAQMPTFADRCWPRPHGKQQGERNKNPAVGKSWTKMPLWTKKGLHFHSFLI